MMSSSTKQNIGNIFSYVALGLIIAAQTNRYWSIIRVTVAGSVFSTDDYYGIYARCDGGTTVCTNYDWTPDDTEEWAAFISRVLLIVSDVFIGGAFIGSFIAFCLSNERRSTCLKTIGAFNIIGGSFTVITAIAYIALALTSFFSTTVSSTASSTGSQSFSVGFCYPFCWVAGVGLIIAGALQVSAANPDTVVVQPAQTVLWTTNQPTVALPTASPYGAGYYNTAAYPVNNQPPQRLRASYPSY